MEFRVLGQVEVLQGDWSVPLGGPVQRALLALLLVHADEVMPVDLLVDELWGETAPTTAKAVVHSYISRLRRLLEPTDRAGPGRQVLVTAPGGYLLRLQPDQLDLRRFERLVEQARQAKAEGRLEDAATGLCAALELWRGPALAGIGSERLRRVAHLLEERRLTVLEERIDLDLTLGRHRELVGELQMLVAAHPFREGLVGQLMLALCGSGRQADALNLYQTTRRTLVGELGIEPGPALQQRQREILAADRTVGLTAPTCAGSALAPTAVSQAPCQLPADLTDFTGRLGALDQVRCLVEEAHSPAAPTVSVITGQAGVGKTTVAVRLAHQLRPRFPDGQLFVNLRGAGTQVLDPVEVLAGFLRALGVDRCAVPAGLDDRVGMYRSLLADRRVLVLLDNVGGAGQVRPLLPSGAGCAALATSRDRVDGLEGARTLVLDVFGTDEALQLLAKVVGEQRTAAEPAAARSIVAYCGNLPLAVRIAAARLAARPDRRLQALAVLLSDERRRLHELRAGDLEVRASIALSYHSQSKNARRAFRLLGLIHAATFPAWLAAAMLGRASDDCEELLERLVDAGLLETTGEDTAGKVRYRFHDLVRVFARERLREQEPARMRHTALERAARAYLVRAAGATPSWFAAEHASLVAMIEQTHAAAMWELTWQLTLAASDFFEAHSHWDDWLHTHELALDASRHREDRHAEAAVLRRLGDLHLDQSKWPAALACFSTCLPIFQELRDRNGEARALAGLGDTHREQGQFAQALACFTSCLPIFRKVGDKRGEAEALRSLGIMLQQEGHLHDALNRLEDCVRISREMGDPRWEAIARRSLGMIYRDQGRLDDARACFEDCLAIFRELGDRLWQAYTMTSLGQTRGEQGAFEDARVLLAESVTIFQLLHDRYGEGYALQALGDILRDQGQLATARTTLERSQGIFRQIDHVLGEAWALQSLGDVLRQDGQLDDARSLLEQAVHIARGLGMQTCQNRAQANLDTIPTTRRQFGSALK
jgi:DNA-binding SARP family transcriptional activator